MDNQRVLLAIILSLAILLGYNYFFIPPAPPAEQASLQTAPDGAAEAQVAAPTASTVPLAPPPPVLPTTQPSRQGRDIHVDTDRYQLVLSENGGGIKSLKLLKYNEQLDPSSGFKELVFQKEAQAYPLYFSFGTAPDKGNVPVFQADTTQLNITSGSKSLTMTTTLPSGIVISRKMTFAADSYQIDLEVTLHNPSDQYQYQGAPFLRMVNRPFTNSKNNRFLFNGPALYMNNDLETIKPKKLAEEPQTRSGQIDWLAYEGTYFMASIMPAGPQNTVYLKMVDEDNVDTTLSSPVVTLLPGAVKTYHYKTYFGPKKLATLKKVGHHLEKVINFGWFDVLAKPMLFMLNYLYGYLHNYGWAIILVTVIIKLLFWPISYKGMKSMRTMQKLQPKMAKLKEKFGDDREAMSRETMALYKTYKVNPVGGCMPMILQIPVFFALYRLLMQTIELRHAPFIGWITDLSAPDRLYIGFHIPYVDGLPVLTLLMGASMFLQQKMTPTPADPTQAKIMMFLPVIFTFMFINFASGLVLYWFVNNLLSIAQQYAINKAPD